MEPSDARQGRPEDHNPQGRLLRRWEVERLTGLPRSTIYAWIKAGLFPRPVRLGPRAVAWPEVDIAGWIARRPHNNEEDRNGAL